MRDGWAELAKPGRGATGGRLCRGGDGGETCTYSIVVKTQLKHKNSGKKETTGHPTAASA